MFIGRRYRILLIFAAIFALALVHFARNRDRPVSTGSTYAPPPSLNRPAFQPPNLNPPPLDKPPVAPAHGFKPEPPAKQESPKKPSPSRPDGNDNANTSPDSSAEQHPDSSSTDSPSPEYWSPSYEHEFGSHGQGRLEVELPESSRPAPHWRKPKLHFPVAPEDLIKLPTGQSKALPKLQAKFPDESSADKMKRLQRLSTIKASFEHAWSGYKASAMGHDEVMPQRGGYRDPFNGWGATLVDTLDTLWIMDLKEEFSMAVDHVKKIDFTTSKRKDIPVFETVIRYLGGLLGAYDVSGHKYSVLLDKAKELAEILMGAFDTPNRMPSLFYHWAPDYASQPHRADVKAVLAELGSLSMEFTRLAQLTRDDKYYDAIARITNELEKIQDSTKLPGLWPIKLDASGCKKFKPPVGEDVVRDSVVSGEEKPSPARKLQLKPEPSDEASYTSYFDPRDDANHLDSRDAEALATHDEQSAESTQHESRAPSEKDCMEGLHSPLSEFETFGLGALADSTYEYLPKEYVLLGGLNDQYETMYKKAMKTAREHLVFRPMLKGGRDVRFLATAALDKPFSEGQATYKYEGSHLSCFAGGMVAIGSKLFGIEEDMDLASQLTDGCVWAYQSTKTGIMPDKFELFPCQETETCAWNETEYHRALDPYMAQRLEKAKTLKEEKQKDAKNSPRKGVIGGSKHKRWRVIAAPTPTAADSSTPTGGDTPTGAEIKDRDDKELGTPSHEEYATQRIMNEHLPPGVTRINSRQYLLRPEAIESVFYMFRLTGDNYWREKGWKMFQAVSKHTKTEFANSAIDDVTVENPEKRDEMESFWLSETLKYFYLLFADPRLVDLDEYVLNTEAHPFKRPEY